MKMQTDKKHNFKQSRPDQLVSNSNNTFFRLNNITVFTVLYIVPPFERIFIEKTLTRVSKLF